MDQKIDYQCAHCGSRKDLTLGYLGANTCAECKPKINYCIISKDYNDYYGKLTITLTKKGCEEFMEKNEVDYKDMKIVTLKEAEIIIKKSELILMKEQKVNLEKNISSIKLDIKYLEEGK